MKIFRSLIIVVFVLRINIESFSQTLGIKAGLNLSNIHFDYESGGQVYNDKFKIKPGFNIGAIVEIPLNKTFSLENNLLLLTKGYRNSYKTQYIDTEGTVNYLCLDFILNSKVSVMFGNLKIYGTLGPYIGFGILGKMKGEAIENNQATAWSNKISWGSNPDDDLRRLDFGLDMGGGVEISHIQIGISYCFGLANLSVIGGNNNIGNRVLGISLGYKF